MKIYRVQEDGADTFEVRAESRQEALEKFAAEVFREQDPDFEQHGFDMTVRLLEDYVDCGEWTVSAEMKPVFNIREVKP